jgi:inosose dehydratase
MTFIRNLSTLGEVAKRCGAILAFHPHLWTLVSTLSEIKKVMEATDPELVKLSADTAHLAGGGAEPTAFLREYRERIVHVQFKDSDERGFVELGEGNLPIRESYEILAEQNYDGWITVELDASEDPRASARANAKYLRTQLGVESLHTHPH